ncbi:MAG: CheR family methyltransferase [Archangium sp.]|nr:CheR family methyltransferase [Archangium sp.]
MTQLAALSASGDLPRVVQALCDRFGLRLSVQGRQQLPALLNKVAEASGTTLPALVQAVLSGHAPSLTAVVDRAVIGETYFFRHREQLEAAVRAAPLLHGSARLMVWSAGCSFGDEAFSVAMLLHERGYDARSASVLGTDVSSLAIAAARTAVYGEWSFRGVDALSRARHFERDAAGEGPRPQVRALVEFRQHNLASQSAPVTGVHLVLCRNVLIYFEPGAAARVLARIYQALVPGGLLTVGPAEQPLAEAAGFEWLPEGEGLVLRRPLAASSHPQTPGVVAPARRSAPARPVWSQTTALRPQTTNAPAPRPHLSTPAPSAPTGDLDPLAEARHAARRGDLEVAERLARALATQRLLPEAWLLVSMMAEQRGDLAAALEATRRALYLEPGMPLAHAAQAALFRHLGQSAESERALRNAIAGVRGLDDAQLLRGVEPLTVGALRRALEQS